MPKRKLDISYQKNGRREKRRASPRAAALTADNIIDDINAIIAAATSRASMNDDITLNKEELDRLNKLLENLKATDSERCLHAVKLCREIFKAIGFSINDHINNEINERLNSLIAKRYTDERSKNPPFDVIIPAYVKCFNELSSLLQELYEKRISETDFETHLTTFCKNFISHRKSMESSSTGASNQGHVLEFTLNILAEDKIDWELTRKMENNVTHLISKILKGFELPIPNIGWQDDCTTIRDLRILWHKEKERKQEENSRVEARSGVSKSCSAPVEGQASSPAGTFSSAGGGEQGSGSSSMPSAFRVVS